MTYQDLKRVNEAPKSGQLLAYTRKEVYFQPYDSLAEAEGLLQEKTLLELHLFDNDKEYRAIVTRSKRFPDGMIETIADFSEEDASEVYRENAQLLKEDSRKTQVSGSTKPKVITVLNHISYEETGMAYVDNYRLQMGGE
ncbi:MAG TPA: hypothetical protein H9967_09190 [Candidatus Dorea faecipullorum]|nr:hypothetical protein [Candidatus Dorea faecipullorum]